MIEVQQPRKADRHEGRPNLAQSRSDRTPSATNRRAKSPVPPIKTNLDPLPEFATRQPSRYAYNSGPTASRGQRSSAEFLLSPDSFAPHTPTGRNASPAQRSGRTSREPSPNRPSPVSGKRPSFGQAEGKKVLITDDSDLESYESAALRQPRARSSRYSFTSSELPSKAGRAPTYTSSSSDEGKRSRVSRLRGSKLDTSSGSPSSSRPSTPTSDNVRSSAQPQPRTPSSALPYEQTANLTPPSASGPAKNNSPPYISAQASRDRYPYSPPQSPKLGPSDIPRSRPHSRQNSRPTTPLSAAGDVIAEVALFDAVNKKLESRDLERARGPSRLSSTMRSESIPTPPGPRIDVYSPSPQMMPASPLPRSPLPKSPLPASALPYPVDDFDHLMPSEAAYQFRHPSPIPEAAAAEPAPRSPTRSVVEPAGLPRKSSLKRPSLSTRHTAAEGVNQAQNDRLSTPTSPGGPADVRLDTVSRPSSPNPAAPRGCPRSKSSTKYDDWYTLGGDDTFNICPDCLMNTVGPTPFHEYFTRATRPPGGRIRCDFSRPWMRLAWLLTLKQQRPDLDLVYAISSISNFEDECPADTEVKRSWYGLVDHHDDAIQDFYICGRDRRYLEALFPSLKQSLVRVSRQTHSCSMDRGASAFGQYLDKLVDIDEKARRSKRSPDLKPFQDLVQQQMILKNLPPCTGDKLTRSANWHFLLSIPEFTVCTKCFVEAVQPHIRSSTRTSPITSSVPLADQFVRTPQPVPRENGLTRGMGSSCQLYSPRMRKIWATAAEVNDERYLARKVRERKAVEMGTYETYATLEKVMKGEEWDKAFVREELDRVKREWKEVE